MILSVEKVLLGTAKIFLGMGCLLVVAGFLDARVLASGSGVWTKPARFMFSFGVHAASMWFFARLIAQTEPLGKWLRSAFWIQIGVLWAEIACITLQGARGVESHFNYSTAFDTWIFRIMGWGTGALFISQVMILADLLYRKSRPRELRMLLAGGTLLSIFGSAIGLMMVLPTPAQGILLEQGERLAVIGAHLVGPATDVKIPGLSWDIGAGDLRLPHFVGLHGLQVALALAWSREYWRAPSAKTCGIVLALYFVLFIGSLALSLNSPWRPAT